MKEQSARPSGFQGYHKPVDGEENPELTHIDRGTKCGEYLRRYWHPVAMSSELGDLPLCLEILGEALVLFRDKTGNLGLLHRHCAHRGASLEYGIVAERGIICCYHGWHYNIDGTLIRAGSEPEDSPVYQRVIQGAYPTHEHNGLIFAYLGPPEERPPFPIYDTESIDGVEAIPFSITTPCNWLQVYENTQDPIHVLHLHALSSGVQFGAASGVEQTIDYKTTPLGMINIQSRKVNNHIWIRSTETILPNCNQTGAIYEEAESEKYFQRSAMLRWMVPVNNTVTRTIGWRFFSDELDPRNQCDRALVGKESIDFIGQTEDERSYTERQRQPGDYEAQVSQRDIAVHGLENHGSYDTGVSRVRHLLRQRVRAIAVGESALHPSPGPNGIATYIQDCVTPWVEHKHGTLDQTEMLTAFGKIITDAIISSDHLSASQRREAIREACLQAFDT